MRKSLGLGLGAAAVIATGLLTPAAGWAAVTGTSAHTSTLAGPGGDPDTTVTFAVTSGLLTLTAPGSANLGTGRPGTTISGQLGQMTVTDDRAALVATWTVTASLTNFTTGAGATLSTIPATDSDYDAGEIVTTGVITANGSPTGLSGTPTPVVEGTAGRGNNTAAWNPLMGVDVPPAAVGGTYTGTLTQSVA
jgi:hypothetical protein